MRWGVLANEHPPVLRTHDRYGHRVDEVEYHPAYHDLMRTSVAHELHALPWRSPGPGAHVARAAMYYVFTQAEQGHGCPITMTFAVVPALARDAGMAADVAAAAHVDRTTTRARFRRRRSAERSPGWR